MTKRTSVPNEFSYDDLDPRLKRQLAVSGAALDLNDPAIRAFLRQVNATYASLREPRQQEGYFHRLVERSSDIIYSADQRGYFTYVNPAAERITGYKQAELIDKHYTELIHPDYRQAAVDFYRVQLSNKQNSTYYEFPIITREGAELWVGQSVQLTDNNGQVEFTALVINISDRKAHEQQMFRQKEKYLNIITNMNLGLIEVDRNEQIRFVNHTFCTISGFDENELIGRRASELLIPDLDRNILREKMALREKGISDMYEVQVKNKAGQLRWWVVSGAPNYDAQGRMSGSIGIHLDITEKKNMEMELESARVKTEASARAKAAFLAHMSHEVRTPLNGIIGMIRELSYEVLSPKQKEYVQNAFVASDHLLSVLNDVLEISKIEAGELNLEQRHFKLKDTVKEVKSIMKQRAREKGLYFGLDLLDVNDMAYIGDPARIRQVLLNLIGNAIKFTEQGGVYVECKIKHRDNDGHTIMLSVEDTGIGMDEAFQRQLFDKFSQEDASTSRKYGGTGLGMAISREIVKLMQGGIEVTSKKGQGTRIEVLFSLPLGDAAKIEHDTITVASATGAPIQVLLVEDNAFNRAVATSTLKRHGCEVTEAVNGQEAVDLLEKRRQHIDVVLMDLQMPVMDGFEATRLIREKIRLAVPIVALTANAFKSELERCLAVGMNDYVTKPFDESRLITAVRRLYAGGGDPVTSPLPATVPLETAPPYDLSQLRQLSANDPDFTPNMIALFIEQANEIMQQLTEAVSKNDTKTIYFLAHRIKPSLDVLGISGLAAPIRELESKARAGEDVSRIPELVSEINRHLRAVLVPLGQELSGPQRS